MRNCIFPKTFNYGLSIYSSRGVSITNSTFYACVEGSIGIFPSGDVIYDYTTDGINISDLSNNFITIAPGKYFNGQVTIVPTPVIRVEYDIYPITYGITGTPDVLLPLTMTYVYIGNSIDPYGFTVLSSRIVSSRYTSDQVYLESQINTYSWYGYQFSTGKHLIENRFNPIPLLNNLSTATPEGSTVLNPHVIEFQLQSDVLLLTDVSMSDVSYNEVIVISDDVSGTYIYNSNVATTINAGYTNNLYIIPNTVPRDLSSNPYPGVNPSALVSVMTASGGAYTYSSDAYKYRLSTVQQSYLPAVRGVQWYTASTTDRLSLLTGPEKVPFAPTVDLSSGDHFLNVTWTDNPGAAPTTTFLSDISSNLEHYTHTDYTSGYNTFQVINNGTTFFVTVTASNEFGSAISAPQTILVATVPDAPTEGATDVSSNSLTVYWSPNYDGGSPILSYNIYWYDASTNLLVGSAHNVSASPYTITGLTRGKSYDWAVSATNAFGEGAQSSQGPSYSPSVPPDPPTNVVGTRLDTAISLVWDPPISSGGSPILYYNIYDASTNVLDISSTSNSTNITGLTNGRPYSFYVKAVNSRGASTASVPSSPVIPAGYPLTSVTGLAVASVGDGTVTLTFDPAPAIVNGAPFVRYNIFQSTDNSFFTLSTVSGTYTVTGLTNGDSYWFTVSIINEVGEGPQSASVGPAVPPIQVTLFLTDLTKTYNGAAQTPTVYSVPSGVTNADVSFNPAGATTVGSYVVTATLTNPLYSGADVSGSFVITQAPLTVTGVTVYNKPYDAMTDAVISAADLSGVYGFDDVSLNSADASGNFVSANVGTGIVVHIGPYSIYGTAAFNYALTNPTFDLTANITPAPLTVTGVTAANKVYDGTTSATISGGDLSGTIYNPDVVNLITTDASGHFVTANAGTGKTVTVNGFRINATNYQITNQPFDISANITPAPATVDVSGLSFTYDTTAHFPRSVTTTPADISYNIDYLASNVNVGSCGFTVYITDPNYSGSTTNVLSIAAAALTITDVSANNKPYDGTRVATLTGGTLNGVYPADSVGIVRGTGTFAQANVGTGIAVTASDFDLSGVQFGNYRLAAQPSVTSANITQALAGIDVSGLTVTYTGSPLAPTIVTTTPAGLSYNISYTGNHTDVSSYPFTVTITDPNYYGSKAGTLVITKARAGITITGLSVVYDGSGHLAAVATTPADLSYNITYAGASQGPFVTVGSYPFSLSIKEANYYGDVSGTLTIAAGSATVDVSGLSVIYNGSQQNPIVTIRNSGGAVITPTYSIVYSDGNHIDAGSHPFVVSITDTNYAGSASGTFTITRAPLLIQANNQIRPYYFIPTVTATTFSYYYFIYGPSYPTTTDIYTKTGLYLRDTLSGVTLTIDPLVNTLLTPVTTQDVSWNFATAELIPGIPNEPYVGALVISNATGSGLSNYNIEYGSGDLSVVPTVADMPLFTVASHYNTTIALSWLPPLTTGGGIPVTVMRFYLYNPDLSGSPGAIFSEDAQQWYQPRDVSASDLGGLYTAIFENVLITDYTFQIAIVNAVGPGILTSLTNQTEATFEENVANASSHIVYISNTTNNEPDVDVNAALTAISGAIASAGTEKVLQGQNILYTFLEEVRSDIDSVPIDGQYAYAESQILAQAIDGISPGATELTLMLNGPPDDISGTQARAVLNHLINAYNLNSASVSPSLIARLTKYIFQDNPHTPFPMILSSQFIIDSNNIQIEPYPVIRVINDSVNIVPVPHRIEIKFYLQVASASRPDISGQVLVTRDANDLITEVSPHTGVSAVSCSVPFPAPAGSILTVTFTNGSQINVAIPALADIIPETSPDAPENVTAVQNGSSILVRWNNPNNPLIISYTISEPSSGFSVTILAPATRFVVNGLSVLGPYTFSVVAATNTPMYSPPGLANYTPRTVPCFPTGTRILTPSGYRVVENLVDTDLVQTADGRAVPVKLYKDHIANPSTKDAPYLVPAHCYGHNLPPADLRLSPLHAFQTKKGLWHVPRHAFNDKVKQYGVGVPVDYYHVECPNYFTDNLVVDGCVVESFAGKQVRDPTKIFTFVPRYQALIRSNGEGNRTGVAISK